MIAYIVLVATSLAIVSILRVENKFQQVAPATGTKRQALTIKNNNTNNDSCWLFIGGVRASKENSIILGPGDPYISLLAVCVIERDPSNLRVEFGYSRCRISIDAER